MEKEPESRRSSPLQEQRAKRLVHSEQFNAQDWLGRLYSLNPWAVEFQYLRNNSSFHSERKAQCIRRLDQGQDVWHSWANSMLTLRAEAEISGVSPNNDFASAEMLRTYQELATADFKDHAFTDPAALIFPGKAIFTAASFSSEIGVSPFFVQAHFHDDAWFDGAIFHNHAAWFMGAEFHGMAIFDSSRFHGRAAFGVARFHGEATFVHTQFEKEACFDEAMFDSDARFDGARFYDIAMFNFARFRRDTRFDGALFEGRAAFCVAQFNPATTPRMASRLRCASFNRARFKAPVAFDDAEFGDASTFNSLESDVAFSLTGAAFRHTPDFIEATFHEAPRLDCCRIESPISEHHIFTSKAETALERWAQGGIAYSKDPRPAGLMRFFPLARDGREHARLRKLRAMAADGRDHENELVFNAYEIAARRFWIDDPGTWLQPGMRFWLGWLYGFTSNYGQSIARPIIAWGTTTFVFWAIFLFWTTDLAAIQHGVRCDRSYEVKSAADIDHQRSRILTGPTGQSLILSVRNALVIDRFDSVVARRVYGCLYGLSKEGGTDGPVIPPSVGLLSAAQAFISAIFLFLTALGIRNMFRIK